MPEGPIISAIEYIYRPYSSTLLAFSGGVDSTVLFFLLLELRARREDFSFEVFYLNHQMPGNEEYGNQAMEWVGKICEVHQVVHHSRIIEKALYETSRLSSEELGRKIRYGMLQEISVERGISTITTAHHRDDLVETALMRLFQGVSPSRLCAMKESRGSLLRPLLSFSKAQLIHLAQEQQWAYLEDPSNEQTHYKRNRLRKELFPKIREQFPLFEQKMVDFLHLLDAQNRDWEVLIPQWTQEKEGSKIERKVLEQCSPHLRRESIKRVIHSFDLSHYFTYRQLESLDRYIFEHQNFYEGEKVLYQKGDICLKKQKFYYICEYHGGKDFSRTQKISIF